MTKIVSAKIIKVEFECKCQSSHKSYFKTKTDHEGDKVDDDKEEQVNNVLEMWHLFLKQKPCINRFFRAKP